MISTIWFTCETFVRISPPFAYFHKAFILDEKITHIHFYKFFQSDSSDVLLAKRFKLQPFWFLSWSLRWLDSTASFWAVHRNFKFFNNFRRAFFTFTSFSVLLKCPRLIIFKSHKIYFLFL